jgi:hypothetical protein
VREGRVPYFVTEPILITRKLLAVPEVSTSPQLLLLRVMPVGTYLVVNTLLLASAGFVGLLRLRRRYGLGAVPFTVLVLLFFGNGHITAQLSVGHSMWVGYFLLSWLVLWVLELLDDDGNDGAGPRRLFGPKLGVLLFALMLQGSFHIFIWCVLLLLLLAAFQTRLWPAVWRGLAWGVALSAVRLAPAVFVTRRRIQEFLTGFPSLLDLLHGLVTVRDAAFGKRGGFFGEVDWWELDVYVGPAGLLLLVVFGLALARRYPVLRGEGERALLAPLLLLALFSYGDAYLALNLSGLPLLDAERATSRLFAIPLVFLIVLASLRLDRWQRDRLQARWRAAVPLLAVAIAAGLLWHSSVWRVAHLRTLVRERRATLAVRIADPGVLTGSDLVYVRTLQGSLAATLAAGSLLLVRLRIRDGGPRPRSPLVPPSTAG